MKFLTEHEVPERVRLNSPLPRPAIEKTDPLLLILEKLTDVVRTQPMPPEPLDLSPIVDAIQYRPMPHPPARKWKFSVQRDADGFLTEIIAEPLE